MATSGNITWELNRNQIIEAALRKLGVLALGVSASATEITNADQALNSFIQLLHTDGMPLWKRTQTTVDLVAADNSYDVTGALKIYQVAKETLTGGDLTDLTEVSHSTFNGLNNELTGTPLHYCVTPTITGSTIQLWPIPDTTSGTNEQLQVVYQKEFDGFFGATETPDFPPYWTDCLIYGLASRLAPEYGLPLNDRSALMKEAEIYHQMALSFGNDSASIFFYPDRD